MYSFHYKEIGFCVNYCNMLPIYLFTLNKIRENLFRKCSSCILLVHTFYGVCTQFRLKKIQVVIVCASLVQAFLAFGTQKQ